MSDAAKPVILTGAGYSSEHFERLRAAGMEHTHLEDGIATAPLLARASGYILGGDERLTASVLDAMTSLQAISFVGGGIGQFVDCEAAKARGVALFRTPGPMVNAVAEHSLGLLIGLHRGIFQYNEAAKCGEARPSITRSLADSRVGLIGLGPIGLRLARQLHETFDCKLSYWSRTRKPEAEKQLGIAYVELNRLLTQVDSALVLLASTPGTRAIIDHDLLGTIRDPILLVNTAAAELVDPIALRRALDDGRITAAAFDGYWREPLPAPSEDAHGLLSYPDSKFVVTPHVAAKTTRTWTRMLDMAVENLIGHFGDCHAAHE